MKVYVSVAVLERADETPLTLEGAKANAPPIVDAAIKVVTPAENFMVYILFQEIERIECYGLYYD